MAFASSTTTVVSPATVAQYVADAISSPKVFFAWVARPEGGIAGICFGSPTHPNGASRVFYASDFGLAGNHIFDIGSAAGGRLSGPAGDEANNVGHVYSAYRDGAVMSIRRDGVEILRKTNATEAYTDTTGTLAIATASGGFSTASWMEFMAYAASMPAANITRIERYLAARWGITLAPQVANADAQDWITRVYQQGGSVSPATAAAVSKFCNSINDAGIRDRFYRLNLFAGSFQGAFVPLFRGIATGSGGNILTKHTNNDGGLFSSALWQVLLASTTTKGSQVAAPDGTLSATSVTLDGTTGSSAGLRMISNGDWVANATGTFSVWARKPASGGANAIRLGTNNTAGWSTGVAQKFALTTEWQRFAVSGAISNTSNLYALIGTQNAASAGAHDPDCNGIVELWRPQIEVGTTATAWQACQYGNATDTNTGSPAFLPTDYAETGATGGLVGNGSSKRLETGFSLASLPSFASRHISVYEIAKSPNQSDVSIGGTHSSSVDGMILGTRDSATTYAWSRGGPSDAVVSASAYTGSAFWIGQNTTLRASQLYKNGILDNAATLTSDVTSTAANTIDLFAWRITGGSPDPAFVAYSSARLGGYSIGLAMDSTQAAAYYTAMQAFQTAMTRSV